MGKELEKRLKKKEAEKRIAEEKLLEAGESNETIG